MSESNFHPFFSKYKNKVRKEHMAEYGRNNLLPDSHFNEADFKAGFEAGQHSLNDNYSMLKNVLERVLDEHGILSDRFEMIRFGFSEDEINEVFKLLDR